MSEGWLPGFIERFGVAGVLALTFLETVFPPIPSEVVMPLAGIAAARGQMTLAEAIAAGTAGSMLGNILFYAAARALGGSRLEFWVARYGRWLTLTPEDLVRVQAWFLRFGGPATFLGRMVPGIRSIISIPAGLVRMPWLAFLAWSLAGTLMWTTALTGTGYALGAAAFDRIEGLLGPVSNAIVVIAFLAYGWRVVRFRRAPS